MIVGSGKVFRQLNKYEAELSSIFFVIQSEKVASKMNGLSFHG